MEMTIDDIYNALPLVRDARKPTTTAIAHSVVIPHASYSPWNDDAEFLVVFGAVRRHTLVDAYRCFELWSLVQQTGGLAGGHILEVGVWRGGTGCLMAKRAALLGHRSKVVLCDTFSGVVKAGDMDSRYRGGEHSDTSLDVVHQLINSLGLDNTLLLQGIFPDETAMAVADMTFSLCHIDVDVYESARGVMDWVWPRLCVGGCVVFDDYGFETCDGITHLVNQIVPKSGAIMLHNLNGHAVFVKTRAE